MWLLVKAVEITSGQDWYLQKNITSQFVMKGAALRLACDKADLVCVSSDCIFSKLLYRSACLDAAPLLKKKTKKKQCKNMFPFSCWLFASWFFMTIALICLWWADRSWGFDLCPVLLLLCLQNIYFPTFCCSLKIFTDSCICIFPTLKWPTSLTRSFSFISSVAEAAGHNSLLSESTNSSFCATRGKENDQKLTIFSGNNSPNLCIMVHTQTGV